MNMENHLDIRNEKIILRTGIDLPSYHYDLALWCKWLDESRPYPITDDASLSHRISSYAQQTSCMRPQKQPEVPRIYIFQHNLQPILVRFDQESTFVDGIPKSKEERINNSAVFFEPIHLECGSNLFSEFENVYDHNSPLVWVRGASLAVYTKFELAYARPLSEHETLTFLNMWKSENLLDLNVYKYIYGTSP